MDNMEQILEDERKIAMKQRRKYLFSSSCFGASFPVRMYHYVTDALEITSPRQRVEQRKAMIEGMAADYEKQIEGFQAKYEVARNNYLVQRMSFFSETEEESEEATRKIEKDWEYENSLKYRYKGRIAKFNSEKFIQNLSEIYIDVHNEGPSKLEISEYQLKHAEKRLKTCYKINLIAEEQKMKFNVLIENCEYILDQPIWQGESIPISDLKKKIIERLKARRNEYDYGIRKWRAWAPRSAE